MNNERGGSSIVGQRRGMCYRRMVLEARKKCEEGGRKQEEMIQGKM
jgi:hypothetical protein